MKKTLDVASKDIPSSITISKNLEESLQPIEIDPEQIRQVILNLLLNAVQAVGGAGNITVSTLLKGDSQTITVSDSGGGISQAEMKKLFIPFFTTKKGGTGLGLPICQRIVQNHGGNINIQSELGQGTSVTIQLPMAYSSPTRETRV